MRHLLLLIGLLLPVLALAQEPAPMSFDDFEAMEAPPSPARKAMRQERAQQIDFAEEMVENTAMQAEERLSLVLRLAHLHHERGRDEDDPAAIERAVALYRQLLARLPDDRLRDHVTFFLGFALRSTDQRQESERLLREVPARWPASSYAPHARLHLGEALFAAERFDEALAAYEAAAATDFELEGFARYKAAWSHERLGRPERARAIMGEVVLDPSRPGLVHAAWEVLDFWTVRDLGAHPEPRFQQALKLALRQEQPATCVDALPRLRRQVLDAPLAADTPHAQLAIVRCLAQQGVTGPARAELNRMEHQFGRGSRWWSANDRWARRQARQDVAQARELVRR